MSNPDIEDTLHRARRNHKNIPNAWDDIWACRSKCWKDNGRPKYRQNRQRKEKVFDRTSWRQYCLFYDWLFRKGYYFEVKREDSWGRHAIEQKITMVWWQ